MDEEEAEKDVKQTEGLYRKGRRCRMYSDPEGGAREGRGAAKKVKRSGKGQAHESLGGVGAERNGRQLQSGRSSLLNVG